MKISLYFKNMGRNYNYPSQNRRYDNPIHSFLIIKEPAPIQATHHTCKENLIQLITL